MLTYRALVGLLPVRAMGSSSSANGTLSNIALHWKKKNRSFSGMVILTVKRKKIMFDLFFKTANCFTVLDFLKNCVLHSKTQRNSWAHDWWDVLSYSGYWQEHSPLHLPWAPRPGFLVCTELLMSLK